MNSREIILKFENPPKGNPFVKYIFKEISSCMGCCEDKMVIKGKECSWGICEECIKKLYEFIK